jgi:hypothetical protein
LEREAVRPTTSSASQRWSSDTELDCEVDCPGSGDCIVRCHPGVDCDFDECERNAIECPDGVRVCGGGDC